MKKYNKYLRYQLAISRVIIATVILVSIFTLGFTIESLAVTSDFINETKQVKIETLVKPIGISNNTGNVTECMCGGVAVWFRPSSDYTEYIDTCIIKNIQDTEIIPITYIEEYGEPWKIRCTGYCDYGYTKSGEYVRKGIIAGKEEWLGKTAIIYRCNDDDSIGEIIGYYEFLDTGYGINGSLINGTSVDIWHPSEDAVWDWMAEYGDYVYIQIVDSVG